MKTNAVKRIAAFAGAALLAMTASAYVWSDGERSWNSGYGSVSLPDGNWASGAQLYNRGYVYNPSFEYVPSPDPRPEGAVIVPDRGITSIYTNGWNAWEGTTLVHYEVVETNWADVVSIGSAAFFGCSNMTSVTLPSTVRGISTEAFRGCTSLVEVNGIENVCDLDPTAFVGTPWWNAFTNGQEFVVLNGVLVAYTGASKDIVIPDNLGITQIGLVFQNNASIRSIKLPSTVVSLPYSAFLNCTALESVVLPSALTEIPSYLFMGCSKLTSVSGAENVTSIGYSAFYGTPLVDKSSGSIQPLVIGSVLADYKGCAGALVVPDGVTSVASSFSCQDCTGLTAVALPDGIRTLPSSMFSGCTDLKSVKLPSSLRSIPESMFQGCTALSSIALPRSVGYINGHAFEDCDSLTTIEIPSSVWSISDYAFAYSGLQTVTGAQGVYFVGECAFEGTDFLDDQTGDFTVLGSLALEYWGDEDMVIPAEITCFSSGLFQDHTELASITMSSGFYSLPLYDIRHYCQELKAINLVGVVDGHVSKDGIVYNESGSSLVFCPSGRSGSVTIPQGVRVIESEAFFSCEELEAISLPSSVEYLGESAFEECSSLASFAIPGKVRRLPYCVFFGCESLATVTGGEAVRSVEADAFSNTPFLLETPGLVRIGSVALGYGGAGYGPTCPAHLAIPEGIAEVADWAFAGQTEITSISLPSTLKRIGNGAFCGCTGLQSVDIPASVEKLGYEAFADCTSLAAVTGGAGLAYVNCGEGNPFRESPFAQQPGATIVGGWMLDYVGECPANYVIPSGVRYIGSWAFDGQTTVESIVIPEGVEEIGAEAFGYCSSLQFVTLPQSLKRMSSWVFECCPRLTNVIGGENVENMGYGCFADTPYAENQADGACILGRCLWGYKGDCPADFAVPDGVVQVVSDAMYDCDVCWRSLHIPASVKRIGDGAFVSCNEGTMITGGEGLEHVSKWSFGGCEVADADGFWRVGPVLLGVERDYEEGETLVIPEGVSVIASWAFDGCGFSHVTFPSTLRTICHSAFVGCENLEDVNLGSGVEIEPWNGGDGYEEGDDAFAGCTRLSKISFASPDVAIAGAFSECWALNEIALPPNGDLTFIGWEGTSGDLYGSGCVQQFWFEDFVFARWAEQPVEPDPAPVVEPDPELYENATAGEFTAADTLFGWLKDASGKTVGTVQIKAGKPNKLGIAKLTATVMRIGEKKVTLKGEASIGVGVTAELSGKGGTITIEFGADGFKGRYGEFSIDGGRDVLASKNAADKPKVDAFARWQGTYTVALLSEPTASNGMTFQGWSVLSVVVGKKGKTKVTGLMADGTKVSATAQMIVGENDTACVPILVQLYSGKKGGFAFLLWVRDDGVRVTSESEWNAAGSKTPFAAQWQDIKAGKLSTGRADPVFAVDESLVQLPAGGVLTDLLPYAEAVNAGTRWKVVEKASKVDKEGNAFGPNPAALKLSYTAKSGLFKGAFKVFYRDAATGKVKSVSATVNGAVVNGEGYGSAVIKKVGSWAVTVR